MDAITIYIICALIIMPLVLNIVATYIVFNTHFEIKSRRTYQILFIWILPFLGSLIAIYINREDYFEQKRKKQIGNNTAFSNTDAISHYIGGNHRAGR